MNKISECIINKDSSFVPIWFMRQAGRYLPEFREIRKKNQNFIKLCLNTKLTTEITLQPISRFNLDAAIIFSDILMIPYGLGQKVEFKKGEGPVLGDLDLNKILEIESKEFVRKMNPVYESISKVKAKTENKNVIGFVGAPWTLLVYMLNKKSPKKNFHINEIIKDNSLIDKLLQKVEETICLHIDKQINAGANIIQIFDSWAGLLPEKNLDKYCYNPTLKIVDHIKKSKVPAICFPKGIGKNYLDFCSLVKPQCISIDYETDPRWAKEKLKEIPIQGGLDPKILLKDNEIIKKEVENYLNIFSGYPYIFNLGHGVLPETKPETIEYVTNLVRKKNERKSS
tara:strand:+ start:286 stop:1308 length:1023 start_codon:yes stop_codon:yes gene_type:complete